MSSGSKQKTASRKTYIYKSERRFWGVKDHTRGPASEAKRDLDPGMSSQDFTNQG